MGGQPAVGFMRISEYLQEKWFVFCKNWIDWVYEGYPVIKCSTREHLEMMDFHGFSTAMFEYQGVCEFPNEVYRCRQCRCGKPWLQGQRGGWLSVYHPAMVKILWMGFLSVNHRSAPDDSLINGDSLIIIGLPTGHWISSYFFHPQCHSMFRFIRFVLNKPGSTRSSRCQVYPRIDYRTITGVEAKGSNVAWYDGMIWDDDNWVPTITSIRWWILNSHELRYYLIAEA